MTATGSLSGPANEALDLGAARAGALRNAGEGGPSEHHRQGADLVCRIGTRYFGCRAPPQLRRRLRHGRRRRGRHGCGPAGLLRLGAFPLRTGFPRAYAALARAGVAQDVTIASGKCGLPDNALVMFALGPDIINVAREAMMAIGCIQSKRQKAM